MIQSGAVAEWVGRLVRVPSVNPAQAGPRAGEPGEGRMAAALVGWFAELGAEVETEAVLPGRPNVYATWRGESDRWVALDAHMDTVGVEQMVGDPFSGDAREGRVHGRGAVDTKASMGVMLALLEAARRSGRRPVPNLLVAATADEESGALGAPVFAAWVRRKGIRLDELAVAEPTGCAPVIGHRGAVRLEFHIRGVAAHSSQPHLGRNAITAAARLALALDAEHQRLQAAPSASPQGAPTLTVTLVHGGRGTNVVPDTCSLCIDRRLVSGEDPDVVREGLLALAREACPLPFKATVLKQFPAFSEGSDGPWVRQLVEWSGEGPGLVPYGTNAWAYSGLARECVVIGPGSIDQAHGDQEWVAIAELERLAGIYGKWLGLMKEEGPSV